MKQRFLSLMAVAAMSVAAMAQQWTAPVAPTNPSSILLENAADVESGTAYYVMNVGAGQFITGANVWATQISLSSDAIPYVALIAETIDYGTQITGTKGTAMAAPASGWTLRLKERYNLTGDHGRTQGQEWTNGFKTDFIYLFRSDADDGYVDLNNQGKGFVWKFTKNNKGYYYIQTSEEDTNFPNALDEYLGSTGAGKKVKFNCTVEDADIDWIFIPADGFDLEGYTSAASSYAAELAIYNARVPLYDMLNDAAKYGADYSAASEVYNNENATVEELNAAVEALKPNVRQAILPYAKKNSTIDNPVDLTKYILVNPDFNAGNIDGWTVTEGIGQNQGYQDNNTYHNAAEDVHIEKFIEAWRPAPNLLNDGKIYQTINGLPSGHYILECDGIARNQTAASSDQWVSPDDYRGIYLFYNDGSITVHSESTLRDVEDPEGDGRLPTHFTFEFDIDDVESVEIGLMSDDTNLNWMAADNFKLAMAGPSQVLPSYTALRTEVATTNAMLNGNDIIAQQTLIDALQAALQESQPLVDDASDSSKDADYKAAYNKLNTARLAVTASQATYAKLATFVKKLEADQSAYNKPGYNVLLQKIEDLYTNMSQGYDNKSISSDEINEAINSYDEMVKNTIQEMFDTAAQAGAPLDQPLDITPLFDLMQFPTNENKSLTNGYPTDAPVWKNATGTANFKINAATAEVWNAYPFDIYREFNNLPKGKYTLKTHAFYRVTDNATNYPAYQNGEYEGDEYAYIYAGNSHTQITNVGALATETQLVEGNDANVGDETTPIYIVNGQAGANKLFTDPAYQAQAESAYISVSSNIIEDGGTLRFGFAGTDLLQGNSWVVIGGVEIFYEGVQGLEEEVQSMLDQLELIDDYGVDGTKALIEKAKQAGESSLTQGKESQEAALKTMQAAIDASKLSKELTQKIGDAFTLYQNKMTELEGTFTDNKLNDILSAIDTSMGSDSYESNEKIQEWLDNLPAAWYDYVLSMQELADASEENPVDLPILVNGTFDDMINQTTAIPTGWTAEFETNGGKGREGVMEFWDASTFDIYQDLPKLKNGYYRLCVDGLYRAGDSNAETEQLIAGNTPANDVYFYALGRAEKKLMQWSDTENGAIPYALADKENVTAIGTLYDLNEELGGFDAPNNQSSLTTFVNEENNRYHNTLVFGYGVDGFAEGSVRIGLKKTVAVAKDWCPFDNFKLEYLGPECPTAVEAVEAQTSNAPAVIYTIDGRQSNRLGRGINIVRQANGKVAKVLVK